MARQWRCANGHTWTGEIGALTFCPQCNSRDVYEVRSGEAGDKSLPPSNSDGSFSQPRRAHRSAKRSAPPAPDAADESTLTQLPRPESTGPAHDPAADPSQMSTQVLHVAPANQSTTLIASPATPANSEETFIQPPPANPSDDTLICRLEGAPGSERATVCQRDAELPTYVASSTSDSTLDLPSTADRMSAIDSTGSWDEPEQSGDTVAMPQSKELGTSADKIVPGSSSETADTKLAAPRRDQPRPKASLGSTPQVAGYEILSVLGRGGMGVVYKARQKGLNRLVALKMIIGGGHAAATDRGRFQTEALAVAKLQHTNIVQVYEVGECDGLPFFSLEYLDGGSLQDKVNGNPLPARIAAAIVEQLARAMQFAHANGIVHRDLKPANILLKVHEEADGVTDSFSEHSSLTGPRPVRLPYTPKITDFGLAKDLQSESGLTGTGAIMGTPSFMSPEQAEGKTREIGPPTDIHALGAILYEAITGRPPYLGSDPVATIMQVRMMEPVPPSRWQPGLPRDLETVCLKCLEKTPARRYATAGDLADDLRRFLDGEPVQARPTSWLEKCWKWAKRRPAVATLIALCSVMIMGGVVAAAAFAQWQHQRAETEHRLRTEAEDQRNRAQLQEKLAKQESTRALANFDAAREAMDAFLTRVGDERLRREPRTERLQAQLLESALGFYDRFLKTSDGAEPAVRREAGWAYQRAGRVREMLGKRADAIAAYREAVRIFGSLAGHAAVDPLDRKGLADSYRQMASALEADNQLAAADEAYASAKSVLDKLIADAPAMPTFRAELAALLNTRGAQLANRRQTAEAIRMFRDALSILQAGGDSKEVRTETARTNTNLGTFLLSVNQIPAGRETLRSAVEEFRRLARSEDDPRCAKELGRAIANLGTAHMLSQQPEEAQHVYRDAEAIFSQLSARFPRVPDYRFELAKTLDNIGELKQVAKGRRAAEAERTQAREIFRDLALGFPEIDEYRLRYALSLDLHGVFLAETGKREEAITAIREATNLLQKLAANDPSDPDVQRHLGQRLVNLGILLAQDGQEAEAESTYARAISILSATVQRWPALDTARKSLIDANSNQAFLMKHLGRPAEEEAAWVRTAELQAKRAADFPDRPDPSVDLARTMSTLAGLRMEKPAQAISALRDAYDQQKTALGLAPQRADLIANLGVYGTSLVEALTSLGDHAAAFAAAERMAADLPQHWNGLPRLAGQMAECLRCAREDKKLSDADRDKAGKQYGRGTLSVLRRAIAGGYKDATALQAMPELAPLRDSPEFKDEFSKLISSMSSK